MIEKISGPLRHPMGEAMKKYWIAVIAIIAIGGIGTWYYFDSSHSDSSGDQSAAIPGSPFPQPAPQTQSPINAGFPFQDTSVLKPPAGAKVALYEFEDMECPACAHAFPIVHTAAEHYKIPLVRRDYPWNFHIWSLDAAVTARYIQDNLSPRLADDFRRDVFANQPAIASKDDLTRFTTNWFKSHGHAAPFVMDASGNCKAEVESDRALGDRVGVKSTPCIFVVTQNNWVAVPYSDIAHLDRYIDDMIAQAAASAAPSQPARLSSEPDRS
jgi:protein-disulfide isomerase